MEFILLLLSSLLLLIPHAAGSSDAVLDVDGNQLQRGELYYVKSVVSPHGGVTWALSNGVCPAVVAQWPLNDGWPGRGVAFYPENKEDKIREGITLYIKFLEKNECSESSMWKFDGEKGTVTLGGSPSSSVGPIYSRFAIQKDEDSASDYKIMVCPCSAGVDRPSCRMGCFEAAWFNNDPPHSVKFVKVHKGYPVIQSAAAMRPKA